MLALSILVSGALAGADSATALAERLADPRTPGTRIAASCAPASGILGKLREVSSAEDLERMADTEAGIALILLDPVAAAAAGFDLDGALTVGVPMAGQGEWFGLPFAGTPSQAEAALSQTRLGAARPEGAGWRLGDGSVAQLQDGLLLVTKRGSAELAPPSPRAELFAGLAPTPGCTVWLQVPPQLAQKAPSLANAQLLLQVPMSGDGVLARVAATKPAPEALARVAAAPVGGSSVEAPSFVLGLGVSPYALADAEIKQDLPLQPAQLARLKRRLPLGPGATLAMFGSPGSQLSVVVVLPVESRLSPRRLASRARKAAEGAGAEVTATASDRFEARVNGKVVQVVARRGRLYLGEELPRVLEAADGLGQSWLLNAPVERMTGWPLTLWTTGIPGPGGAPMSMDLGLRARDGIWEIEAQVQVPEGALLDQLIRDVPSRP